MATCPLKFSLSEKNPSLPGESDCTKSDCAWYSVIEYPNDTIGGCAMLKIAESLGSISAQNK